MRSQHALILTSGPVYTHVMVLAAFYKPCRSSAPTESSHIMMTQTEEVSGQGTTLLLKKDTIFEASTLAERNLDQLSTCI